MDIIRGSGNPSAPLCSEATLPIRESGNLGGTYAAEPNDIQVVNRHVYQSGAYDSAGRPNQTAQRQGISRGQRGRHRSRNTAEAGVYELTPAGFQSLEPQLQEAALAYPRTHSGGRGQGRSTHARARRSGDSRRWQPEAGSTAEVSEASASCTQNGHRSIEVPVERPLPQSDNGSQLPSAPTTQDVAAPGEHNLGKSRRVADSAGLHTTGSAAATSSTDGPLWELRDFRGPGRGGSGSSRGGSRGRGPSVASAFGRLFDTAAGNQTEFSIRKGRRGAGGRGGSHVQASIIDRSSCEGVQDTEQPIISPPRRGDTAGAPGASAFGQSETAARPPADSTRSNSEGETLTCVICCEEATAVAVGSCGHSHTCAKCCLRLRLCCRDLRCPLCKAVNKEVVVARHPLPQGSSFESLAGSQQQREALWQQPKWAKGVLVYEPPSEPLPQHAEQQQQRPLHGASQRRNLHKTLMAMTSLSCSVCDRYGQRPFGTMNLLLKHLRSHNKALCDVCLGAGLKFPLEYSTYDPSGLAAHLAGEHPRCEYCDLAFYGPDELYGHMTQHHFTCHVCSRLGRHHLYFSDADTLLVHLREEHHACEHPDCFGCMIAFATRDELATHIRERHSSHMPRWEQSRARPLLLDFIPSRGQAAAATGASGASSRTGERGDRRGRTSDRALGGVGVSSNAQRPGADQRQQPDRTGLRDLEDPNAFPSLRPQAPSQLQSSVQQRQAGLASMHEGEGGLVVIDDDIGLGQGSEAGSVRGGLGGANSSASAAQAGRPTRPADAAGIRSQGPPVRLAGVWAGRQPGSGTFREDFPELSAAASSVPSTAPRTAWATSGRPLGEPGAVLGSPPQSLATAASLLSLRKVTIRCPCGNKVDHLALRPDEKPPQLACDRNCVAKQRRAQLAEAFGVEAVDSHVPYFDRHRAPHYTAEHILASHAAGIEWVASVERELARFIADPSARRTALAPGMSQSQRKLVHELAEHYGLASHSVGLGACRAVQLLKGAASGVPIRLLSAVAAATSPEELARLASSSGSPSMGGLVMTLVDVAPGTDVHKYLWAWDGEYTLTPVAGSSSSLRLTFSRESAFRDCCTRLGGGIRGVFRTVVEREQDSFERAMAATATGSRAAAGAPGPAAPAVAPLGWQVLRGKPAAPGPHKLGAASRRSSGADPALSMRSALAADAWASDDEDSDPRMQSKRKPSHEGFMDGLGRRALGDSGDELSRNGLEVQMLSRNPPLDLPLSTPWSALLCEGGYVSGDGDGSRDLVGVRADGEGSTAAAIGVMGTMEGSWDDFDVQGNEAN